MIDLEPFRKNYFLRKFLLFNQTITGLLLYIFYPVIVIAITFLSTRNKEMTLNNYFFLNTDKWLVSGLSVFTVLVLAPYLIPLASISLVQGFLLYCLASIIISIAAIRFLLPEFSRCGIRTLPEFFEKKFNRKCRIYLSSVYLVANLLLRFVIVLAVLKYFTSFIIGDSGYSLLIFFILLTGIYTIIGGVKAEFYTNIIHVIFLSISAAGFIYWALYQDSGIERPLFRNQGLYPSYDLISSFNISTILLVLLVALFLFSDSLLVNKLLTHKNYSVTRKSILFVLILLVFPVVLYTLIQIFPFSFPLFSISITTMTAALKSNSVPGSVTGLLLLGSAAILMSSSAALLNNTSSLITYDIYRVFKPYESDRKLVLVARLSSTVLLFIAILLIHLNSSMDYSTLNEIFRTFCFFAAVTTTVFICSLLIKNVSPSAVIFSVTSALVIIVFRIIFDAAALYTDTWFTSTDITFFSFFLILYTSLSFILYNRVTSTVKYFGKYLSIGSVKK